MREVNRKREQEDKTEKDRESVGLLRRKCKEDLKLNSGYEGGKNRLRNTTHMHVK